MDANTHAGPRPRFCDMEMALAYLVIINFIILIILIIAYY